MEQLTHLVGGFGAVLTPMNLVWIVVGAFLGTAVGVMPGLGSAMAVALLLPMTFTLDPLAALILFSGVYFGGLFGDSTAGILMNTPGNSTAIATTFEGHTMARTGRAPQALATSAIGAFVGGLLATVLVVFFAPAMADLATEFGPGEYFALALFAFVAISSIVSDSPLKGVAALTIGLGLALVGTDQSTGTARFTFGVPALFDGVSIVVITVAVLAVGEVLHTAGRVGHRGAHEIVPSAGRPWLSGRDLRAALPAWLRGAGIGIPFGIIPAGGAEVPTFLAYSAERQLDRRRRRPMFGKGAIQGVAAPEAAGNATAGSAMGALLSLGLPTSATAAVLLAAFQQYGMQPGPLLFERNGEIVWALLAGLLLATVALLIINLPFAPLWAKLLLLPQSYLYAGITVFACLGVYATGASRTDLAIMCVLGALAFAMRRTGVPLAPVLIAVILGPLAEYSLRDAMANSGNDPLTLVGSPITLSLYALLLLGIAWAVRQRLRPTVPDRPAGDAEGVAGETDASGPRGA
ncbi:putative tricarboxylic transport membrane protein [Nocardiopsis flavescens]|uniref:Putative tricarboxylic transport membrane protein n=1 Tax=Nocardiopsis flavescens TaxID=758803 RepID=A0A1M6L692_9ACTN|nr:tripartite tricarboxylate transporter permease [Nocardiopsis flavescens]SHJ66569.1 putative tricarboxylic transport membrane protein [Nocardiopsis flavescens]